MDGVRLTGDAVIAFGNHLLQPPPQFLRCEFGVMLFDQWQDQRELAKFNLPAISIYQVNFNWENRQR